ncbi:hypothetical protein MNBD_ALPHA11-2198 [hydrothermal vent metagenome]|uniref:Uncharacterized protein n=1 Tax=hydrothermal vent metagenome TaxID=652676 RepID=A0A3B0UH97_9ZZZZ
MGGFLILWKKRRAELWKYFAVIFSVAIKVLIGHISARRYIAKLFLFKSMLGDISIQILG